MAETIDSDGSFVDFDNAEEIREKVREFGRIENEQEANAKLRKYLKTLGFDSIVYENTQDRDHGDPIDASFILFDPEQLKSADVVTYDDNGNPIPLLQRFDVSQEDLRFSLREEDGDRTVSNKDSDVETAIIRSMTMQQAKDMVQRAFVLSGAKEWYEGEYRNGDEWLRGVGVDDVAMVIDNEWRLQEKYLNKIKGLMDEEFFTSDILKAYLAGTLKGEQTQATKPMRLNTHVDVPVQDERFYAPRRIEAAKVAYETACQKVTNKNRDEVYKARADVIMFAHTRGAAEVLGLTQSELNKKLRTWARYTAKAKEMSQRFNSGVADWNRWTGIENSNILSHTTVSNEDLDQLVGEVIGDSDGYQRKYIMRTMLALDTHIDYSGLKFEFVGVPDATKRGVNGQYFDNDRKIRVKYNAPNTVAHEMGHFLDYQWARDIGLHRALTDGFGRTSLADADIKQWVDNFDKFIDSLTDVSDITSEYTMASSEVFARFVDKFVRWVNFTANGEQTRNYFDRNDRFTAQHYIEFVRLLQEKSALDGKKLQSQQESSQHSLKEQTDLMRKNAKLKEVNQALRDQFKRTKVAKVDRKALDAYARQLLKDYESVADIVETRDMLDGLFTYIANGEEGQSAVWDTAWQKAYDTAVHILENVVVLDDEMYRAYKDLRDMIRTTGISMSKEYDHDLVGYESLSEFRKANFGRIKIVNDGVPVDVFYNELASVYPDFFDEAEVASQPDMLLRIEEVLNAMRPTEVNSYSHNMREAATWLANDIMERFFELPQAQPTFADKAERRMTEKAIKDAKKLADLRDQKNEKIKRIISENRAKIKQIQQTERERRQAAIKKVSDHYKAKERKASESRKAQILRARIMRHTNDLRKKLLRPTDKQHVPESLRVAVADLLAAINLESNYTYDPASDSYKKNDDGLPTNQTKKWLEVKAQYAAILANEKTNFGIVLDPILLGDPASGIPCLLDKVIAMSDIRIADMSLTQLETVWDVIRIIEHSITTAGKMLTRSKWARTTEAADAFVASTATRREKRSLSKRHYMLDIETPYTFFSHFGDAGHDFFRMLRDAQDAERSMLDQVVDRVGKVVSKELRRKAEKDTQEFTTTRGDTLTLSKAHMMEIYLLSKRPQARGHLLGGGLYQPEIGKNRRGKKAIKLTEVDLAKITSALTDDERKIADGLQKTTLMLAEWGNEASMQAYGYEKFKDPNYWTVKSAPEGTKRTVEQRPNRPCSIANTGSAKNVVPDASNALDIGGIFSTFDQHVSDMLCYSAWLCVMEDANRLFNYTFRDENFNPTGETMSGLLDTYGGDGSQQYWLRLMEDIQNGLSVRFDTATESVIMKAIGNVKKASVSGNLRVVVQQPTAYMRALAVLDIDSMAVALGKDTAALVPAVKGWNKAVKYAPIAARKAAGGFEIGSNPRQLADILYKSETKGGKFVDGVKEAPLWAAGKMDEVTWGTIWNACEHQIGKDKTIEKGSKAFYEAVAELFTEVIDQTQVVDGVLQRSQAMRSGSNFVKQMTSFTGEPTQAANVVIRAWDKLRYETDPQKRSKAIKGLSRAVSTYMITAALNAFAQSLVDAFRDDDDEKGYWERVWKAFSGINGNEKIWWDFARNILLAGNMSNNINPASWLPVWKDVLSLVQGYSVERMDAASIGDFIDSIGNSIKSIGGNGKYTIGYALTKTFSVGGKIFGSSAYNILRDVQGLVRTFQVVANNLDALYNTERLLTNPKNNLNAYLDLLFQAYETDQELYKSIYQDLLKNGCEADKIRKGMERRMKEEQGVTKVSDLQKRFLPPKQQKKFDAGMKQIYDSVLWSAASAEQRKEAEARQYDLVIMNASGERMREAIDSGAKYGLSEEEYLLYHLALDIYDTPNKNGKLGGAPTNAEKADAILALDGLTDSDIAYLWDTDDGYRAYANGVDMRAYISRVGDGNRVDVDKVIGAQEVGLDTDDYFMFLDMLDKYDAPTKNGELGTFSQDETKKAIEALRGLSDVQKSYLWLSVNSGWVKSNPYN